MLPCAPYCCASPLPRSLLLPCYVRASHRCPPLTRGRWRLVAAPLPVLVARDPLLDPRGHPHLPLVAGAPSSAPVGEDAVAPGVAEAALDCVRGDPERPLGVTSLPPAIWVFSVASLAASPDYICPRTRGSLSHGRASPSGSATSAAGNGGSAPPARKVR